eukprot:3028574-Pyramimonas_sp.AAC.1
MTRQIYTFASQRGPRTVFSAAHAVQYRWCKLCCADNGVQPMLCGTSGAINEVYNMVSTMCGAM